MTRDDVIDLLTVAAGYDRRKAGRTDVDAWCLAVGDLSFDDAKAAVAGHYRDSAEWLMPAHVRTRVKAIRADRIARAEIPAPSPELDPVAYRAALAASVRLAADGQLPAAGTPHAITGQRERRNGPPASLAASLTELRGDLQAARQAETPGDPE